MSTTATPAASVAGTGAISSGAPSPSADLENQQGTPTAGEGGGSSSPEPEGGAAQQAQPEPGTEAGKEGATEEGLDADGRAVPAKWREAFKNDPELKALFFERRAFQKEFPGGIQEVRGLKQTLDLVGGNEGLQKMQTDIADYRGLANHFLDGSPEFVADLFENDAIAAMSHLPTYLDKAREADEPGYNRLIAQRIHAEHDSVGLRPALKSAHDAIPKGPEGDEARRLLNGIAGWHDKLQKVAEQEEDPRVKKLQDQIRDGRKSADAEQLKTLNQSYQAEAAQAIDKSIDRILGSYLKGRKIPDEDLSTIKEQIKLRTNRAILDDKEYTKNRDMVGARRDKPALLKLATNRWNKELEIVIPKVARLFGLGSPKPAPAAGNGNGTPAAAPAAAGFTKVDVPPDPKTIDTYRTSRDMIVKQHQAILKDGKKVQWALAG